MTLDQQFNNLNDKLQLLLKQYNRVQKEAEKLKEELRLKEAAAKEQQQQIDDLQQQVSILKLGAGELSDKDKKDFEKKINQYIREIDKAIAYLSQ